MKSNKRLENLIDNYLEQKESLSPYLFEGKESYKITISEKEEMIKYCINKIVILKFLSTIYGLLGIIISVLSLVLVYSCLEKIINNNLISYIISFAVFCIVNEFLLRKFWKTGKEKRNYEMLLETLRDVK